MAAAGETYGDVARVDGSGRYEASKRFVRNAGSVLSGRRGVARRGERARGSSRRGDRASSGTLEGRGGGTTWSSARDCRYVCRRRRIVKIRLPPAEKPLRNILRASRPSASA